MCTNIKGEIRPIRDAHVKKSTRVNISGVFALFVGLSISICDMTTGRRALDYYGLDGHFINLQYVNLISRNFFRPA